MSALGRRAVAGAGLALLGVLALGVAAGGIRLLPWLWAPEVPVEVALPFARALGAAASETALVVGAPLGAALAVASFVDRGEARALFAVGASPARLTWGAAHYVVSFVIAAALASAAWGSNADVPGRFAAELIAQGRASCARATAPKSAQVPLVGVTWLCFPGEAPRATGGLPGLGELGSFTARALRPSDDLRQVHFEDLRVFTRKLDDQRTLELSVQTATVRGLPGWGRSAKLPFLSRTALSAGTAALLALGVIFTVLLLGVTRRWSALAVGGIPSLAAFVSLSRFDASSLPAAACVLVPIVGAVTLVGVALAVRAAPMDLTRLRRLSRRR